VPDVAVSLRGGILLPGRTWENPLLAAQTLSLTSAPPARHRNNRPMKTTIAQDKILDEILNPKPPTK
jgi:hypothetical protein